MSKTIFITGASTGLGKATAKLFSSKGWNVLATMRNTEAGKDLASLPGVRLAPLDVTDAMAIENAVNDAATGVDVVFNNAGYGLVGPLEGTSDEQIVREVNTNLLGVIRVTKAFISSFREKRAGLFINTTSIGGLVAFPFNSVYHATKWAIEGWSESMAFELEQFGIGIKTVSPGGIKTDFMSRSLVQTHHSEYDGLVSQVFNAFTNPERTQNYSSAEEIAGIVYEAATDGKKQLRYVAGKDAKMLYAQRMEAGDEAFRANIQKMFFE